MQIKQAVYFELGESGGSVKKKLANVQLHVDSYWIVQGPPCISHKEHIKERNTESSLCLFTFCLDIKTAAAMRNISFQPKA